jgi:signal transduction histidine kinase
MADRLYSLHVIAQNDYVSTFLSANTALLYEVIGISMSVVVAFTSVAVACGWVYFIDVSNRRKQDAVAVSASRDTHNAIVGYVCHELRNPLHVLETWVRVMFQKRAGGGSPDAHGAADAGVNDSQAVDWQQVSEDVHGALLQMRNTVDDVLDFRKVW